MDTLDLAIIFMIIAGAAASAHWRKLTPLAALSGAVCGWAVYMGDGVRGLSLLALFFAFGTTATSWRKKEKRDIRGSAAHQPTRRTGQVIANGGVAATAGLLVLFFPDHRQLFSLMLAASLASATADTLASELGMVYGHRTFNVLTLKPEERGLDGVISAEGLLIGVIGSGLIALGYILIPHTIPPTHLTNSYAAFVLIVAGTIGNLADSILGALLERRSLLNNDGVNFLNTLIAAASAAALTGFHG